MDFDKPAIVVEQDATSTQTYLAPDLETALDFLEAKARVQLLQFSSDDPTVRLVIGYFEQSNHLAAADALASLTNNRYQLSLVAPDDIEILFPKQVSEDLYEARGATLLPDFEEIERSAL